MQHIVQHVARRHRHTHAQTSLPELYCFSHCLLSLLFIIGTVYHPLLPRAGSQAPRPRPFRPLAAARPLVGARLRACSVALGCRSAAASVAYGDLAGGAGHGLMLHYRRPRLWARIRNIFKSIKEALSIGQAWPACGTGMAVLDSGRMMRSD